MTTTTISLLNSIQTRQKIPEFRFFSGAGRVGVHAETMHNLK